jgi:cob(I)alamin adenosyltransferase
MQVCGAVDEAVPALGMGRATLEDPALQEILLELQRGLFANPAEIAASREHAKLVPGTSSVTPRLPPCFEEAIDALVAEHPLRPVFVVPGANPASDAFDLARTFLRRAERRLIAARKDGTTVSGTVIACVNRASDLADALVRVPAGESDEPLTHQ